MATGNENEPASDAPDATLDHRVIACACPDCGAPMSVRRWLMVAECSFCETRIALSFADIDALSQTSATHAVAAPAEAVRAPHAAREVAAIAPVIAPSRPAAATIATLPPLPTPRARHARGGAGPLLAPAARAPKATVDDVLMSDDRLRDLLAWFASAIAHLLLLMLLFFLTQPTVEDPLRIVLSVDFSQDRIEGELPNEYVAVVTPDFDLPVEETPTHQIERDALAKADEEVPDMRFDADAPARKPPDLNIVRDELNADDPYRRMVAARDPRIRAEVVRREGGTTSTEAAVARALRWFARHQNHDGSWSLDAFHHAPDCRGRCEGLGSVHSDMGGTGLALQAFLGAGQTHQSGEHQDEVALGLRFLLENQDDDGDLRGDSATNAGMYAHAIATIALCDAYQLTGDERLRDPAHRAIDFICDAQHDAGGWRYKPGQDGDTSVIGWQLMALHTGRAARLEFSNDVFYAAREYLDAAQVDDDGAYYAYRPLRGREASPAMTAEGLLSRMYLGWNRQRRGLRIGVTALAEEHPPDVSNPNMYYWYYATQLMHHWGGPIWARWNREMRDILVATQETRGHEAGSWSIGSFHDMPGGRLYMTALACCTLEVYYRHAPLFRKIDLR